MWFFALFFYKLDKRWAKTCALFTGVGFIAGAIFGWKFREWVHDVATDIADGADVDGPGIHHGAPPPRGR